MSLTDAARDTLARLEAEHLLRSPLEIDGTQGPELVIGGRSVLCLCSNNYLGLANHPELIRAAEEALAREGLGAGASRLISGTMRSHRDAETELARFVGMPSALLFSSGYAANVGTLQALATRADVIFSDELNHASLIDGCRLSRATVHRYRHGDPAHLESLLRAHRHEGATAFIVSDALFSMDGDRAPAAALHELARRYDAALVLDEAHSLGVLGPDGRGLAAEAGIVPDVVIGTLGKAFGTAGAFVASSSPVIRLLENRARSFVFSTAPPPPIAAATRCAVALVEAANEARARLRGHSIRLRAALRDQGHRVPEDDTPIVPVLIGDASETMRLSRDLLDLGVFAHGIRPPTVPPGTSRLRIVPMATHTDEQIDRAIAAFAHLASPRSHP